jgi:hypothetical protein
LNELILTLFTAFFGAAVAQFLSHFLTLNREKKKEAKSVYQEFVYPFINDVLLFVETETHFRKNSDVEKEIDGEKLLQEISNKIKFGNTKLLESIHNYNLSATFFDGKGYAKDVNKLKVFFWFLDYSFEKIKGFEGFDNQMLMKIQKIQKWYGIWILLAEIYGYHSSINILKWKWVLSEKYIDDEVDVTHLTNLIDYDEPISSSKPVRIFLNDLKLEFKSSKNYPGHLNQIFDDFIK